MHNLNRHSSTENAQSGFTLVEVTIAMVIIAALLGGVLVGRDMINAANIRATIHQIEEYNAARASFEMRFSAVPGDMRNATTHFAHYTPVAVTDGNGDGYLLDDDDVVAELTGEIIQFWAHLSAADMIKDDYDGTSVVGEGFPRMALNRAGVGVYGVTDESNFYFLGVDSSDDPGTDDTTNMKNSVTPEEAYNIDSKLDDGHPTFGKITATNATSFDGTDIDNYDTDGGGPGAYTACTFTLSTDPDHSEATYAIAAGDVNCMLRVEWN